MFFWMPHFNASLRCAWPAAEHSSAACFMERRQAQCKRAFKEVKEEKKEVEEACVLIVRESKKVGALGWSKE